MRSMICALAVSVIAAGPALATDSPAKADQQKPQPQAAARTVYVCDNSAMTRRAFAREHGKTEFVTAEAAAAAKGETWTAPKCMKPAEARRLKELAKR